MRKRVIVLLYVALAASVACRKEAPAPAPARVVRVRKTVSPPQNMKGAKVNVAVQPGAEIPVFFDHALLGAGLDPAGNATAETDMFKPGQPVYLTIWMKESPEGLRTRVEWSDEKGLFFREQKDMLGKKVATFAYTKKLKKGSYKVTGYWGGNEAVEKTFTVR